MKKIFLCNILIFISVVAFAQTLQDTLKQLDELFGTFQPQHPGCQLAISRNGVVIYYRAWGMADLEHQVPLTTRSVIEAGSVSKQFTAAAILLLAQQGKLSLDDDIRKYLSEIPDYGTMIRIKHLLHHTSGLRDWGTLMAITGWPRTTKTYSNDDVLYILSHQKSLNNKPGDEFIYSNSNYNLLALIVKRVSGVELADFTRKYLFKPVGMMSTQWHDDFKRIVPNRAIAYNKLDTGFKTDMPNEYAYGHGGLITTAEDLLKWNEFYWNGLLGNPSLLPQQIAVDHLNNGVENPYAAGLFIGHRGGWDYVWHDGATAGYRSLLLCYPQLNLSVAYLSNYSEIDFVMLHKVADLFAPNKDKSVCPISTTAKLIKQPASRLKAFTGWYRNEKTGAGIELTIANDTLRTANYKLLATGPGTFISGDLQVIFKNKCFFLITAGRDTTVYVSVKTAGIGEVYLKEYIGQYYSLETESKCAVILKNGKLILHTDPVNDRALMPTYYNSFSLANNGGDLYFEHNTDGKVTGYKISVGQVINSARNVEYRKVRQ